ncbi:MAG: membrane-bound lytic murein transglycosylase MltF [Rhodocyclaceae bacterium]|nr:membrane-bound lytic murein transglycosylase MltF [Rhodocyclaceae bacterium]
MFPTPGTRTVRPVFARPVAFAFLLFLLCLCLTACSRIAPPAHIGELVVGIRETPAFYQLEEGAGSGYEYDLAAAFALELGVKLRVVPARDPEQLAKLLREGRIHIAMSMPIVEGNSDLFFTPPLRESSFVVAYNADGIGPDSIADLANRSITLSAHSPAHQLLKKLPVKVKLHNWNKGDEIGLLELLSKHQADLVVTDSLHFDIASNFYPDLRIGLSLPGRIQLGWAFFDGDSELYTKALTFVENARADGTLARLEDRYFGHIRRINYVGITRFLEDVQTKLPDFRRDFQVAQELTGIDWRLLAALAYQESKWDPLATSFTGVRGMMMLTGDTADRLGVSNRLDPKQSIRAGAKYLADLADDLPEEAKEPDRLWLALAAYNLGMGHMNGARAIAEGLKRDPNSWYEMKKVLPLLAKPEYYARLKSGKARGGEAVIMVENIRTYYDTLSRFEPAYRPLMN